jgi:hypothetical protein
MCCVDSSGGRGEDCTLVARPDVMSLLYCASCAWYDEVCCGRRSGKVSIVVESCGDGWIRVAGEIGGAAEIARVFRRTSLDHCEE